MMENDTSGQFEQLTLGEVVDTNDPQQMGRVRVACPYFGDNNDTLIKNIPWALPISPLAGATHTTARGRQNEKSHGPISYGMFNIPKIGSYVLMACVEGDPKHRIYLGGVHGQFLPHTLPHGRYTYQSDEAGILDGEPSGPLSSSGHRIYPLYDNQTTTFEKTQAQVITDTAAPADPRKNFEYRTRGADNSVAAITSLFIDDPEVRYTDMVDDLEETFEEPDGNTITHTVGYHKSRVEEGLTSEVTDYAYDPQTYSWTTPGFHSISMADNAENCRIRVRTTHGHQLIMDDTNERIYLGTASGKTWIELDEKGNIDIYGERNISVHAEKDINLTAGDTFRVKAKNGIHLISENEVRCHAITGNLHLKSGDDLLISATNIFATATTDIHIKAMGGVLNLESGSLTNILAGGNIHQTGSQIHLNGPGATAATGANTLDAWWTNRVPEHEPWSRVMTKASVTDQDFGNTHANAAEYPYTNVNVGRLERGDDLARNNNWHR